MVIRSRQQTWELLLVEHEQQTVGFPKGHLHPGESALQAARRELREETGFTDVVIDGALGDIVRHSIAADGTARTKTIKMYRARLCSDANTGSTEETWTWLEVTEALRRLHYREDRRFLASVLPSICGK